MEFRVGEKKNLDKITIEEWGFANMRIMQELLKQKILANVNALSFPRAFVAPLASFIAREIGLSRLETS
jgi:hypothetical protein